MSESLLHSEIIKEIESLIQSFQVEEARAKLNQIDIGKIPKKDRALFASQARKCGELKLAIKILQPNVFGVGRPDYEDLIEYAGSLRQLGLINQALILLERAQRLPRTHLGLALCHISNWNFKAAQIELEVFLADTEISVEEKLEGHGKLVVCLVENQEFEKALNLLDQLEQEYIKYNPNLILNLKEIRGQVYFKMNRLDQSIELLESLKKQFGENLVQAGFLVEKWLILAKFKKGLLNEESKEIKEFLKYTRNKGEWELLRDLTWQMARITKDPEQMHHVFFGTPSPFFREHMVKEWGSQNFPLTYNWKDGRSSEGHAQSFDFYQMNDIPAAYGKSIHRLLMLLAADFYQPWSVVRIFNSLFPEELFDPNTSIKKVYRLIEQLGQMIEKNDLHFTLETTVEGYRLRPTPGCVFTMHREMIFTSRETFLAHMLKTQGLTERFRAKDAQDVIPMNQHQWYRAFRNMEDLGLIESIEGSNSFYSLKKVS